MHVVMLPLLGAFATECDSWKWEDNFTHYKFQNVTECQKDLLPRHHLQTTREIFVEHVERLST